MHVSRLRSTRTGEDVSIRGTLTADAPLAPLVWFKAGGAAEWLFEPKDASALSCAISTRPCLSWRLVSAPT